MVFLVLVVLYLISYHIQYIYPRVVSWAKLLKSLARETNLNVIVEGKRGRVAAVCCVRTECLMYMYQRGWVEVTIDRGWRLLTS